MVGCLHRWTVGKGGFLGEVSLYTLAEDTAAYIPRKGVTCLELTDLFVHPQRRGRGWATELLTTATKYADDTATDLFLRVVSYGKVSGASVEALTALYAAHGFKPFRRYDPSGREMVRRARRGKKTA
jgi:GNAT superfamily N-acetyltransferase